MQTLVTEDAGAVRERKRHDDEVALLQRANLGTNLLDDPDCLMAHALRAS